MSFSLHSVQMHRLDDEPSPVFFDACAIICEAGYEIVTLLGDSKGRINHPEYT